MVLNLLNHKFVCKMNLRMSIKSFRRKWVQRDLTFQAAKNRELL